MLTFGESFLRGDVPNRDFLHLYGPGGVWVLAGVFEVFGVSLVVERVVGLLQLLGIIGGVFLLAWPWGRKVALTGAVITAFVIIPPIGLTALAWNGGIALGLLGLAATLGAIRATTPRARSWLAILGGVLLGAALLYRPDLVLGVALAGFFLVRASDRPIRVRTARLVRCRGVPVLRALRDGGDRRLDPGHAHRPRLQPARWPSPAAATEPRRLRRVPRAGSSTTSRSRGRSPTSTDRCSSRSGSGCCSCRSARSSWTATRLRRREPTAFRGIVLATVAAFSIGILPQALQRPDPTHLAWVSCVPFGFLPVVAYEAVRRRRPTFSPTRGVPGERRRDRRSCWRCSCRSSWCVTTPTRRWRPSA